MVSPLAKAKTKTKPLRVIVALLSLLAVAAASDASSSSSLPLTEDQQRAAPPSEHHHDRTRPAQAFESSSSTSTLSTNDNGRAETFQANGKRLRTRVNNGNDERQVINGNDITPNETLDGEKKGFQSVKTEWKERVSDVPPPTEPSPQRRRLEDRTDTQRLLVKCQDRFELECYQSVMKLNGDLSPTSVLRMAHEFKGTNLFAVEVAQSNADAINIALRNTDFVQNIEEDPERFVSELHDSVRILNLNEDDPELVPYGVDLIRARDVWRRYRKRGEGATICVIDTGLRADHEDLRREKLDGSNSAELVTPWAQDGYFYGHGTHVTGTIVAQPNDVGIVGVAPDANIFVARVFNNKGRFFGSDIANALYECKNAGVDIVSMSFGGSKKSTAEIAAAKDLTNSGILLMAASGNHGDGTNRIDYPAGYDEVMAIGAVDRRKEYAYFSTYGPQVSVVAPGVRTMSLSSSTTKSYRESSGTSMACPHVAGMAALLISLKPDVSGQQLRKLIEDTAIDLGNAGFDDYYGHGLVDAVAAARELTGSSGFEGTDGESYWDERPETGDDAKSEMTRISVAINFDYYASDTLFEVLDMDRNIVGSGSRFHDTLHNASMDFELPSGCYWFGIRDVYGDGLCCDFGSGSYDVRYNGERHVYSERFRGTEEWQYFGTCANDRDAPSRCGDGIINDEFEECDDGNTIGGDGCSIDCRVEQICGDGKLDEGEECDDGGRVNGDGCSANCRIEEITDGTGTLIDCGADRAPLKLRMYTDKYSKSENHYYLTVANTNEYIWYEYLYTLEQGKRIEREACLDPSLCYLFTFNDSYGDGLLVTPPGSQDAVSLWYRGSEVMSIEPKAVVNQLMTYVGNCPDGMQPQSAHVEVKALGT